MTYIIIELITNPSLLGGRTLPDIVQLGIGILTVGISILAILLAKRSMKLAKDISDQNQKFLEKQQKNNHDFLVVLQNRIEAVASCHFAASSNYNYLSLLTKKLGKQKQGTNEYENTWSEMKKIFSNIDKITSGYKNMEKI